MPARTRRPHFWLDFAVTLTNIAWPTIALWALVVATQTSSLNY